MPRGSHNVNAGGELMRILVIGDYISDVYTFGTATRLCPEAPVPVITHGCRKESAGGAGLVEAQIIELGTEVEGRYHSYSEKWRYFADGHLICRIDKDNMSGYYTEKSFLKRLQPSDLESFDAF